MNFIISKYGMILSMLLIIIVAAIANPVFLTAGNLLNILRQTAALGLICFGETFVIVSGGVDLSVGSILSLVGVTSVMFIPSCGLVLALILGIAIGGLVGTVNGFLVTKTGGTMGKAFIITYGMQTVLGATALMITGGNIQWGYKYSKYYKVIGQDSIGIVPISVIIFATFAIVAHLLLMKSEFGRGVFCIGLNDEASRLAGLRAGTIRTLAYTICGTLTGVGAVCLCSRVTSASPVQGVGYELNAIAAVLLGGTRLGGGAGSIAKTVIGVFLWGMMTNALNVVGITAYPQKIVKGAIILLAVLLDIRSTKAENAILAAGV